MIQIRQADWQTMVCEAQSSEEVCGFLAGREGISIAVLPVENELHSSTRFRMNPLAQLHAMEEMDRQGWELLAIYHSHPQGQLQPSPTDLAEISWRGVPYLILAPQAGIWQCLAFSVSKQGAQPLEWCFAA